MSLSRQLPTLGTSQIPMSTNYGGGPEPFKVKSGNNVFTPHDLAVTVRPGNSVSDPLGHQILTSVSQWSFEDKKYHKAIHITSIDDPSSSFQISFSDFRDAFWLDAKTVASVKDNKDGTATDLYAISVEGNRSSEPVYVGSFPTTTVENLVYNEAAGQLVFSDQVYSDGDLYTVRKQDAEQNPKNTGTTALVYDDTFERHWDEWMTTKAPSLFSVSLAQRGGKWELSKNFVNVLYGTNHISPVRPFGGRDNFDVSSKYIVYVAKDPELPQAVHSKTNVYLASLLGGGSPTELSSGEHGAITFPIINPVNDKVAWLEQAKDKYEADKNQIIIYDLTSRKKRYLATKWDRSPSEIRFSKSGEVIYITAPEYGRIKIFALSIASEEDPTVITHDSAVTGIQPLDNNRLLFTSSSITSPNDAFYIADTGKIEKAIAEGNPYQQIDKINQLTHFGDSSLKKFDISPPEEFWFKGAEDKDVHGWINKPKGWSKSSTEKSKYPAVLLIHGGPQGAWSDQWSTRWNPSVFAQQGYFTVQINPTGSTGYGQDFTDAIKEDYGGKVFVDLLKGWKHVLENHPEIDQTRLVGAGASFGGYAINWIQGHPELDFNFKAVVNHDGVFDYYNLAYATEELYPAAWDQGGLPWAAEARETFAKINPINFVEHWSIPQLTIHSSKDYRVPESQGLAAYHALQWRGVPSRLLIFTDENHWILKPGNLVKWHHEVFRWFDRYIRSGSTQDAV